MSLRPSAWPITDGGAVPRPSEEATRRSPRHSGPDLRLVEGGAEARKARLSPRKRLIGLVAMVGVVLFGVVAFHVILSQGEFKLENMSAKADAQQDQYERLRLQVAQLESPARITAEAQNRLGMVTPDKVTPVTPNAADMPRTSTAGSGQVGSGSGSTDTTDDPGNWSQVKSQLNSTVK